MIYRKLLEERGKVTIPVCGKQQFRLLENMLLAFQGTGIACDKKEWANPLAGVICVAPGAGCFERPVRRQRL